MYFEKVRDKQVFSSALTFRFLPHTLKGQVRTEVDCASLFFFKGAIVRISV